MKNRVHLDVKVSGGRHVEQALPGEQDPRGRRPAGGRRRIGAARSSRGPGGLDHVVLQDPEGNELCVV